MAEEDSIATVPGLNAPVGPDLPRCLPFNEDLYRTWNPDVHAAMVDGSLSSPRAHWDRCGVRERRLPYAAREERFPSPSLGPGDVITQSLAAEENWLGGIALHVCTGGQLCRLRMQFAIRDVRSGILLAESEYDEWLQEGEEQALKFPAIEDARERSLELEIRIEAVEPPGVLHFVCETITPGRAMFWDAMDCRRAGLALELRYTPPTLVGPGGVTLNPSTACRASCIHCLSRTYRERPGTLKEEWLAALRRHFDDGPGSAYCVDYATDFFRATKRRPELLDLITAGACLSVNTDGQDVTEPILRRLYAGGTERLGFSCDAATEATYAVVRRGLGRLETVLEAARTAVRIRRELGLGRRPIIALSMVVMRRNVCEAVTMVELAAGTGVDAVWFNLLWVCSEDMVEESLEFTPGLWRENLARAEERGRELGVEVHNFPAIRPEHPQRGIGWCPEPWRSMVVMGNGEVLACASPASRIGNLNESSMEEIWNGPDFQALRRAVHSDRPPLMCLHCPIYRKPGNSDGAFMHHLLSDYDLRRDLAEPEYAAAFSKRFSFAERHAQIANRLTSKELDTSQVPGGTKW